ncbi:MAG: Type 1 glutamine amidotransferase-like domain-containing protein, partial [Gammaproteobacteria bacterium]|nr:Type 1 glutamine amidotransferase-like domain-containing protein [Gammaproteobacteria bacterium]
ETLAQCVGVVITGGNVIILLNRMRMFGLTSMLSDRPVIAWSAGAMVLTDQIVLFHDRMPEGRRDPELLGNGLGLVPGFLILPDARRRLRLHDKTRLSLFCPRFSPRRCTLLDCESKLAIRDGRLETANAVRTIKPDGRIGKLVLP